MDITVVDLGSLRCRALTMGWSEEKGGLQLLGLVELPSSGVIQGEVVNRQKASSVLAEALRLLEQQTHRTIRELYLLYSGVTLGSHNSWGITGTTPIRGHSDPRNSQARCVTSEDVTRALNSAAELRISQDLERLHEIPRCYKLDGNIIGKDIIGSNGIRLEAEVHIITCLREAVDNLIDIACQNEYNPVEIVHTCIASSYIGVSAEELAQGCLLIDIGYGSTSYQFSYEGQPLLTESIGLGGYHITRDIAEIFETNFDIAEQLKLQHGICWPAFVSEGDQVIIPGGATSMAQRITLLELCEVLNARIEEIFQILQNRLQRCGIDKVHIQSIVLVGGSSLLYGMSELAEEVFTAPSRLGLPNEAILENDMIQSRNWLSPQYTALFGLAVYSFDEIRRIHAHSFTPKTWQQEFSNSDFQKSPLKSMFSWIKRKFS